MEDAIKKIDGVNDATVSFMMQKLTIDADDARFDEIMQEVVSAAGGEIIELLREGHAVRVVEKAVQRAVAARMRRDAVDRRSVPSSA
mgnify:CR=1 FL=1